MGRLVLVAAALLLGTTACGRAMSVRSAAPLHNIVVYARPSHMSSRAAEVSGPMIVARAGIDGSDWKKLATGDHPAVSPDGRLVAFGRGRRVLVMPAAGGTAERVYTVRGKRAGWGIPVWAPDSRHLAFGTSGGLVVLDVLYHRARLLRQVGDSFSFSPDSRRIAYDASDTTGGDIYVVPARGGKSVRITDDHESSVPVWGKPGIAFVHFSRKANRWRGDIWLSDGRENHVQQLTHAGTDAVPVAFSADGSKLLAAYPPSNSGRLYAVDVATGAEHPITPWRGDLYAQAISADGKRVLAIEGCGVGPMYGQLEEIPFAGGRPHVIALGPCSASWNAR